MRVSRDQWTHIFHVIELVLRNKFQNFQNTFFYFEQKDNIGLSLSEVLIKFVKALCFIL